MSQLPRAGAGAVASASAPGSPHSATPLYIEEATTRVRPRVLLVVLLCFALAPLAEESLGVVYLSLNMRGAKRLTAAEALQLRGLAGGAPVPNVAWLMSGSVRTLPLPFVYKSIKQNAIDAFGGRSYVLGYLKTEESPDLMFIDNWDVHRATENSTRRFGALEPILAHLDFSVVEVVRILNDTTTASLNAECEFMRMQHVEILPRYVGQMRSLAKVWAMLLEFERKQGIAFDFVMRVRPDTAFLHPLPPWPEWVEAANEDREAGLGGPGSGLGMHTWYPGPRLDPAVTSYRERAGSHPLFLPPENCFLDVPADHFTIHTRASAESTFSMAAQYDRCKGTDLSAPLTTHACCGGGITSLNIWSILQQHPNATLTNFFFPVLLVRPRWVTHDSCTARNDPAQRYGGDWLPRCAMNNMPGCGKEDRDELAIAVANAGPWAPARQRARN